MFKKSDQYKLATEYPTDLGRLLKGFQDFINDAGWEGETLYPEKRIKDKRGKFANRFEWVVSCSPPDHLYNINGIAEFYDQKQRNAAGLRSVRLINGHTQGHKKCLMEINQLQKTEIINNKLEKFLMSNLDDPVIANEKLFLKNKKIPVRVIDHVLKSAYVGKIPSINMLKEYVDSIKHKVRPEIKP